MNVHILMHMDTGAVYDLTVASCYSLLLQYNVDDRETVSRRIGYNSTIQLSIHLLYLLEPNVDTVLLKVQGSATKHTRVLGTEAPQIRQKAVMLETLRSRYPTIVGVTGSPSIRVSETTE
jgi:hypothetical protein